MIGSRIYLIASLFFLFSIKLVAQDTIVKIDHTTLISKILEINSKKIIFKKFANPDGPNYVLDRKYVDKIIYANGTVDVISGESPNTVFEATKPVPLSTDFGKNFISVNIFDAAFGLVTIGYERFLNSGKFSFKVPVSVGFRSLKVSDTTTNYEEYYYNNVWSNIGYYNKYKNYSVGLDLYFYTGGQGTVRYFIGPAVEFGQFQYQSAVSTYSGNYPYNYLTVYTKEKGTYVAFLVKNGFNFQPTKSFNISLNLGAGIYGAHLINNYSNNNFDFPFFGPDHILAYEFGFNVGYRF